jgi:hypothetical protein
MKKDLIKLTNLSISSISENQDIKYSNKSPLLPLLPLPFIYIQSTHQSGVIP